VSSAPPPPHSRRPPAPSLTAPSSAAPSARRRVVNEFLRTASHALTRRRRSAAAVPTPASWARCWPPPRPVPPGPGAGTLPVGRSSRSSRQRHVEESPDLLEEAPRRVLHREVAPRDHDQLAPAHELVKRLGRSRGDDVVGFSLDEQCRTSDVREPAEIGTTVDELVTHRPKQAPARPRDPVDFPHSLRIDRPLVGTIGP